MTLRLLAVHAHPDDESSKGAASYAHYLARGVRVLVATCTGGEEGEVLGESVKKLPASRRDLTGLRRKEMAAARKIIGFEHAWLGFRDSGYAHVEASRNPGETPTLPELPAGSFAQLPLQQVAEPLIYLVRKYRPHVLISYNEQGGYPHPDHIRAHQISALAWQAAANPDAFPQAGPAWTIQKWYYDAVLNPSRARAIHKHLQENHPESPRLEDAKKVAKHLDDHADDHTTQIPCGEHFEKRDAALRAHASQVPENSGFFFWPNDVQRQAWPYESYKLHASRVQSSETQNDLFEGIKNPAKTGTQKHSQKNSGKP